MTQASTTATERRPEALADDGLPSGRIARTFVALRDPHFRMLYFGNLLQFGSMNMQLVVRGWLVFDLTGSFAALGTMSLANAIPMLMLAPIGGVIADRAPKKTLIQFAQGYNAINAAALAILAAGWFGLSLEFWHLFASSFLQGVVNSTMQPARQAFISDIVPRERLTNAIGINASGQTLMQLVAPGIAGFMIAAVSPATVFWSMGAMYAVAMVFTGRLPKHPLYAFARSDAGVAAALARGNGHGGGLGRGGLKDLADGMRYVSHDPVIRMVIAVNFLIVIVAMPYTMLLPGFVRDVLDKGAFEQGTLQSVQGIGAFAGAMFVASAASTGRGKMFIACGALLGVSILAFSLSTNFWITLPIMVLIGAGQSSRMALGQVLIQVYSDERYRGRVMSVYFMEFGLVQLGTFVVGILAEILGPQVALGGLAVLLLVAMLCVSLFTPRMRALD
jgi:MFS family permease